MFISISGNIGSGKSTVINSLKQLYSPAINVVPEPVSDWYPFLELFYKDQKKWAFSLQLQVANSFKHPENLPKFSIYERSAQESLLIFSSLLKDDNLLSDKEYDIIQFITDKYCWKPNLTIHINTDPHICLERINKRNRSVENSISIDYLHKLHNKYNTFSYDLLIDGNQPKEYVINKVKEAVISKYEEVFGYSP